MSNYPNNRYAYPHNQQQIPQQPQQYGPPSNNNNNNNATYSLPPQYARQAPQQPYDRNAYPQYHQNQAPHGHPQPSQGPMYDQHQTWSAPNMYASNDPRERRDGPDDFNQQSPPPSQLGPSRATAQPPQPSGRPPPPPQQPPPHHVPDTYSPYTQRAHHQSAPLLHHQQQQQQPQQQQMGYAMYDDNLSQQSVPSRSSANPMAQLPPALPSRGGMSSQPMFDEVDTRRRAAEVFQRYDRDLSGFLNFQEFSEALRALQLLITYDDAERKFYRADLDGNQRISKREFIEMYLQEFRNMPPPPPPSY